MSYDEIVAKLQTLSIDQDFLGSSLRQWVIALAVAAVAFLIIPVVLSIVKRRVKRFGENPRTTWFRGVYAVMDQTRIWFLFAVSLWIGSLFLSLPASSQSRFEQLVIIILLLQTAVWATRFIQWWIDRRHEHRVEHDPAEATTMAALGFVGKLVVYSIVLLLILDNLGIDVTALIAGLGVGGIAVALAAQNILGDLFSSLSIVFDKPFVLGDFIIVGDDMGTVEKIGLKTTRVRALSGEQLIFANSDLLSSRVRNFRRMSERRTVFSIGVTYDTPKQTLSEIPELIRQTIEALDNTRFDRSHLAKFGDSALIFETVYYVLSSEYNVFMDLQQQINLDLIGLFEERGIEFAFPTRTVHLHHESTPGQSGG